MICHGFNCHINERENLKICSTNHKGSISHHITPLVINTLRGGHIYTHIHTNTYTQTHTDFVERSNFKKPGVCRPSAGAPGLKIKSI